MRVAVIPVSFPLGNNEPYLAGEGCALAPLCEALFVIPVRARGALRGTHKDMQVIAEPLCSPAVLAAALRSCYRVIAAPQKWRHRIKNLAILPKALATAAWLIENRIEHVHAYWLSTPATVAYIAASIAEIEWSATAHRWDIYEGNLREMKLGSARFVRTISARGRRDLRATAQARARVYCVRLGVEMPPHRAPEMRRGDTLRLLVPAALVAVKNHALLIAAIAITRSRGVPVMCRIAGKGPLRKTLERAVTRAGLSDAIHFVGHLAQRDLHAQLRDGCYDAVVLASRDDGPRAMEGIPAALIEAMAFGVPVVTTASGSIPELVDARTGYLARPGDAESLAEQLELLWREPALAHARRDRAAIVVRERHQAARQARALFDLISPPEALQGRSA